MSELFGFADVQVEVLDMRKKLLGPEHACIQSSGKLT